MAGFKVLLLPSLPPSYLQRSSTFRRRIPSSGNSMTGRCFLFIRAYSSGGGGGGGGGGEEQGGDKAAQDALVEILRLQRGQIEVDEFVKEKAELLKNIAEGASEDYQRIADDVNKGMEEIGSKVLESMEADVEELEQEMAQSRAQIEADEREFAEFEKKLVRDRSEGLFFKSLFQPVSKRKQQQMKPAEEQLGKMTEVTKKASKSSPRMAVYAALFVLLAVTIGEAIASGEELYKVGIYSVLLVCLLLQIGYEKFFAVQDEKKN